MFATVLVSLFLYLLPPFLRSKLKVKKDIELLTGLSLKILRLEMIFFCNFDLQGP